MPVHGFFLGVLLHECADRSAPSFELKSYSEEILTIKVFLSHNPLFGHILLHIQYKMWAKSGVWDHKKFDSKNFSTAKSSKFLKTLFLNWSKRSCAIIQGPPYLLAHPIQKGVLHSINSWIWPLNFICLGFCVLLISKKNFVTLSQKLWIFF